MYMRIYLNIESPFAAFGLESGLLVPALTLLVLGFSSPLAVLDLGAPALLHVFHLHVLLYLFAL